MSINQRVAVLESQMNELQAGQALLSEGHKEINGKLDNILSVATAAKHTGNFVIDNLPRIVGGVVAGLSSVGIVAATQSQNVSTFFGG